LRLQIVIDFPDVFTVIQQILRFYSDLPQWLHKLKDCILSYNTVNSERYINAFWSPSLNN